MAVLAMTSYATCCAASDLPGPDSLFGALGRLLPIRDIFAAEVFYTVFLTVLIISIGIFRDRKTVEEVANRATRRLRRADRTAAAYRRYVDKLSKEIDRLHARHVDDMVELRRLRDQCKFDHEEKQRISTLLMESLNDPVVPHWLDTFGSTVKKFGAFVKQYRDLTWKYSPELIEHRRRGTIPPVRQQESFRLFNARQPSLATSTQWLQYRSHRADVSPLRAERNELAGQHDKLMALKKTTTDEFDNIKRDLNNEIRSKALLIDQQAAHVSQLQQRLDSAEKLTAEAKDALSLAVEAAINAARAEERPLASQDSALLVENAVQLARANEQKRTSDKAAKVQQEFNRVFKEEQAIRTLADGEFDNFRQELLEKERSQELLIDRQAETIRQLQQRIDSTEGLTASQAAVDQAVNLARAEEQAKTSEASQNSALLVDNAVKLARTDEQEQARQRALLVQQEFDHQLAASISHL
jgi:hypothetical protein